MPILHCHAHHAVVMQGVVEGSGDRALYSGDTDYCGACLGFDNDCRDEARDKDSVVLPVAVVMYCCVTSFDIRSDADGRRHVARGRGQSELAVSEFLPPIIIITVLELSKGRSNTSTCWVTRYMWGHTVLAGLSLRCFDVDGEVMRLRTSLGKDHCAAMGWCGV